MTSTILVAGATGNTGKGVVATLSKLLKTTSEIPSYRILALTRSLTSASAQKLAELPNVEVIEQNWVDIDADWLKQNNVVRAFIASHNDVSQFAEESTFYLAALKAGVEYVVRISTTAANVRPDCAAFYPRTHWAIESLLSSPEFDGLKWTSLQPNIFYAHYVGPAAELVKKFKKTGKQDPLILMASEDAPVGVIDPFEIGIIAAKLLLEKNVNKHNKARYVLNGPEDVTGKDVVELAESYIGAKVQDVRFKDVSFVEYMVAQSQHSKSVIRSIAHAPETAWEGKCTVATTSKEILDLYAPRVTAAEFFKAALDQ